MARSKLRPPASGRPAVKAGVRTGEVVHYEARYGGARAAAVNISGEAIYAPLCIAVRPGAEIVAAGADEEDVNSRTRVLRFVSGLVGKKILMTPSVAEFAHIHVDGEIAVAPARRGLQEELRAARPSTVIVPHLHLIEDGRLLADLLAELRQACPAATLVAPGCGHPWRLALYAYLGVDIVDTSTLLPVLREGRTAGTDGLQEHCRCHTDPSAHLLAECAEEEDRVWRAILAGNLRELVERRALVEPFLMSALRQSDLHHSASGSFVESGFPTDCDINASSRESLYRPDLQRWRTRVRERSAAPSWAKILLLSPCSFKKPYASSRTHQKLDALLESSGLGDVVHKVVVTSPVGLVPEEVDCVPPASTYDIPVIGVWDANEREMIANELHAYLKGNAYDLVINHVSTEIPALKDLANVTTVDDHPLSGPSQEALLRALKGSGIDPGERKESRRGRFLAHMDALARFQFGVPLGFDAARKERVPDGYRSILGIGRKEAAIWTERPLSLLEAGAAALADKGVHLVTVEDIKLTGDIFAPGVVEATSDFRRGDEVAVGARTAAGMDVRAAGIAQMSGLDIREQRRGRAVAVKRRFAKVEKA